jgi:hypothetical protein
LLKCVEHETWSKQKSICSSRLCLLNNMQPTKETPTTLLQLTHEIRSLILELLLVRSSPITVWLAKLLSRLSFGSPITKNKLRWDNVAITGSRRDCKPRLQHQRRPWPRLQRRNVCPRVQALANLSYRVCRAICCVPKTSSC